MEINELLGKALSIGNDAVFEVRFYEPNDYLYEVKKLNYLQLGAFLIGNTETIKRIDIRSKPK